MQRDVLIVSLKYYLSILSGIFFMFDWEILRKKGIKFHESKMKNSRRAPAIGRKNSLNDIKPSLFRSSLGWFTLMQCGKDQNSQHRRVESLQNYNALWEKSVKLVLVRVMAQRGKPLGKLGRVWYIE